MYKKPIKLTTRFLENFKASKDVNKLQEVQQKTRQESNKAGKEVVRVFATKVETKKANSSGLKKYGSKKASLSKEMRKQQDKSKNASNKARTHKGI